MKDIVTEWFTIIKEENNELYGSIDIHSAKFLLDNMKEFLNKSNIKSRIDSDYIRDMYRNETTLVINGDEFDIESIKDNFCNGINIISSYLLYNSVIKSNLSKEDMDHYNSIRKYFNIDF